MRSTSAQIRPCGASAANSLLIVAAGVRRLYSLDLSALLAQPVHDIFRTVGRTTRRVHGAMARAAVSLFRIGHHAVVCERIALEHALADGRGRAHQWQDGCTEAQRHLEPPRPAARRRGGRGSDAIGREAARSASRAERDRLSRNGGTTRRVRPGRPNQLQPVSHESRGIASLIRPEGRTTSYAILLASLIQEWLNLVPMKPLLRLAALSITCS